MGEVIAAFQTKDVKMTRDWALHREDMITPDEFQRLRAYLRQRAELAEVRRTRLPIRDEAIVLTAFFSGLRRAELAALNVEDVKLKNLSPFIVVRRGKGGRFREVTIGNKLRALLKRYLGWKRSWGESLEPEAALFCSERGRFTGSGIARVFKGACVRAGIRPHNVHRARHWHGTNFYAATKDLVALRKQLGHSRLTTTQVYTGLLDHEVAAAVDKFEKYISTPVEKGVNGSRRSPRNGFRLISAGGQR